MRPGDVASILTNIEAGNILILPNMNRLGAVIKEVLAPALREFQIDVQIGKPPRVIKLDLKTYTAIGTVRKEAECPPDIRECFPLVLPLAKYSQIELEQIVLARAQASSIVITPSAARLVDRFLNIIAIRPDSVYFVPARWCGRGWRMPFVSRRAPLELAPEVREELDRLSASRTQSRSRVERARMLLAYADGQKVSAIARQLRTNRPKVERCLSRALEFGVPAALKDLPRPGKPPAITPEARTWLVALACRKPTEVGYPEETWTTRRLAVHARKYGPKDGHPSLRQLGRGTVSKILRAQPIRPHKISYYLERRDPEFKRKMAEVLCVYRAVALMRAKGNGGDQQLVAVLSYDEKPGIQAIENTAPDRPPLPGKHPNVGRDYEYRRHGTVSLLAGIDLLSGKVWAQVRERHRSKEFVEFLKLLDDNYPPAFTLRIILDNHSAHISRETRAYLSTRPGRYEFVFTPTHGSWLNLVESFFAKLAKTVLRGIRVRSQQELVERLLRYLQELNEDPVVFRWRYKVENVAVAESTH